MLFITLEDFTGPIEVIVFPRVLQKTPHIFKKDTVVLIEGSVSDGGEEEVKVIAGSAREITLERLQKLAARHTPQEAAYSKIQASISSPSFFLTLPSRITQDKLSRLKVIINAFPGNVPLYLRIDSERVKIVKTSFKVTVNEELKQQVDQLLSPVSRL